MSPLGLWNDEFPIPNLFTTARTELRGMIFSDADSELALRVLPEDFQSREEEMSYWEGLSAAGKLLWGLPYNPNLGKRLHRIGAPTLIVWGKGDRLVHPEYAEMFRSGIEGSHAVVLDGCAHMPHLEAPQKTIAEVSRFLTQA